MSSNAPPKRAQEAFKSLSRRRAHVGHSLKKKRLLPLGKKGGGKGNCVPRQGILGSGPFGLVIPKARETLARLRAVELRGPPSFLSLEVGRPFARKTPSNEEIVFSKYWNDLIFFFWTCKPRKYYSCKTVSAKVINIIISRRNKKS